MVNKYYIESGTWRVSLHANNFLVAVHKSLKNLLDNADSSLARLSGSICVSQKGYILDLFDDDLKKIFSDEEIVARQEDYVIITEVKGVMTDPVEDIVFLSTEQILKQIGYAGKEVRDWSNKDTNGLNVR